MDNSRANDYISYQNMISTVSTGIQSMKTVCEKLHIESKINVLENINERLKNHVFSVGVMGEFRRGKSTVINALLAKEIVPSDIVPTSATLNYIRWNSTPSAQIIYKKDDPDDENEQAKVETVKVEDLAKYVTKITEEAAEIAETVDYAVVNYPCRFCQNGVQIIDTPGLNDDDRMTKIAESVIPTLDAVIIVLSPDSPFSDSEANFISTKIMTSDLGRIIFLLNKADRLDEEEKEALLKHMQGKICNSVVSKIEAIYGNDSEEYADAKKAFSNVKVYPVSARNALRGKLDGDSEKVEKSGFLEFESVLNKLLTEERGLLELVPAVSQIKACSKEVKAEIERQLNTMEMDMAEFEEIQNTAMNDIQEQREKKKDEINNLKNKASSIYTELLPWVENAYAGLEEHLLNYADNCPIDRSDVSNDSRKKMKLQEVSEELTAETNSYLSNAVETITLKINERLGKDLIGLNAFTSEFARSLENIQQMITKQNDNKAVTWGAIALDTVTSAFGGPVAIGGILTGWEKGGIPGALIGGGAGFVAGFAAITAAFAIGGTIIAGWPIALIGGIASSLGGKFVVSKLPIPQSAGRIEKEIESLRSIIRTYILNSIESMKAERPLEIWLKDTAANTYSKAAEDADAEFEAALGDFENSLAQIKINIAESKTEKENRKETLNAQVEIVRKMWEKIAPIDEKLTTSLKIE